MKVLMILCLAILTISCSSHKIYLTPAIYGQVLDSKTGNTLNNQGVIFTIGSLNSSTDLDGNFYLDAFKGNIPTPSEKRMLEQTIKFNFSGYEFKDIEYSSYLKEPFTSNQTSKVEIDIGKVYLEPKKQP